MKKLDDYTMNLIQKNGFVIKIFERDHVKNEEETKSIRTVKVCYSVDPDGKVSSKYFVNENSTAFKGACEHIAKLIQSGYTLDSKDIIISLPTVVKLGTIGKVFYNTNETSPILFHFIGLNSKERFSEREKETIDEKIRWMV